ncbi:GNAT family N-acetyltransferase [Nonlabens ponticola]|uniref:GNAT family N-acetyltransferase n=1 Tax=Nonlabens ponticola TaxID=2496866 RepID=A0A3S9N0B5_9FLAO|nr:GNAT family N-acetyltransferase [Nonlabens ponticola]AZQ44941.1 GNAT family N-acetyltransferase [Nonlabens ponticola]
MNCDIIQLNPSAAATLTSLALKSKAYWDYPAAWLDLWKEDLKVDQEYFEKFMLYGIYRYNKIIGFYSYQLQDRTAYIDMLFIDPIFIGRQLGSRLLSHCLNKIKDHGIQTAYLYSDPHAQVFYEKHGFCETGKIKTAIQNRFLPIMTYQLD